MPKPARTAVSVRSHHKVTPKPAPVVSARLELPLPPATFSPAAVTAWVDLAAWAERELRPQDVGLFTDFCAVTGDLADARATWVAAGCPLTMSRPVGPHTGLASHPLLAALDSLGKQKLRLAAALQLLPPPVRPTAGPAPVQLTAAEQEQAEFDASDESRRIGQKYFND